LSGFGSNPSGRSRTNPILARSVRRTVEHPADVAEEDEEAIREVQRQEPILDRSGLGSWKYDDESDVDSADDDDQADKQGEMGVLGLIRQLQKTQGEGTRTGSGI
jgi:hypothetical protein